MSCNEFTYSYQDLSVLKTEDESAFDTLLIKLWEEAMKAGLFRYKLSKNCLPCKILPGKFNYIAQLNPDRAQKRRKPQEIQSPNQPFNPDQFNFNKIEKEEVLIKLSPEWATPGENLLLINVSPLEYCHVLLTPFRDQNRPQKITREGFRLALDLVLLSHSCDLRVGFNSLCGFASVNHEHWHAYYLTHNLFIETALLKIISKRLNCYILEDPDFPPGFCFILNQLRNEDDIRVFLDNVMTLVAHLQEKDIAHNVYITRCSPNSIGDGSIRVFIWARTSSFGAKGCDAFNPALCELAGHFPIKSEHAYKELSEEFIMKQLHEICDEPFRSVMDWISASESEDPTHHQV